MEPKIDASTISAQGKQQEFIEGDPKYMSPELMKNQLGRPADVFSLGIMLLEMCGDFDLPNNGYLWHQLRKGT
jgi:serine/threonine protein kinase